MQPAAGRAADAFDLACCRPIRFSGVSRGMMCELLRPRRAYPCVVAPQQCETLLECMEVAPASLFSNRDIAPAEVELVSNDTCSARYLCLQATYEH